MKTNKISIAVFVLLLTFYFISTGWAATYYVSSNGIDSNSGTTVDAPFKTIQFAVNIAVAGDSIFITPGNYNERVQTKNSGTNDNYISIGGSKSAIINNGFDIKHAYIKINNLTIRGNGLSNNQYVLYFDGASYCNISNNIIEYTMPTETASNVGGIQLAADTSHITINNNIIRGMRATTIVTNGSSSSHVFDNNIITGRQDADGDMDVFRVYGHDHTISKNDVSNFSGGIREHLDFVQTFATIEDPNRDSYNILIDSNFVHNLAGQIGDIQCILSPNIHDWTFRNNVFANITGTFAVGIPRVFFYNNTFYKVSITHPFSFRIIEGTHNGIEGVVKNNLFVNCADGRTDAGWYGKQADTVVDYNYVACGDSFMPPDEYFDEIHGIEGGDPKFVDISNNAFQLKSDSPAKDSGATLTDFSVDKDGTTRPQGSAWDIGAYEYQFAASHKLGVGSLIKNSEGPTIKWFE